MQFGQLKRRKFITLLAGAATAWPLAARSQQPDRMRRIDVMMALPEDDRLGRQQARALRAGLRDLGWTDGRNVRMDFHWDISEAGRAQIVGKDIVTVQPDLIVSHAVLATTAVSQLTKSTPIIFVSVPDPVVLGLVSSLARPGGNVTGFTNFEPSMSAKWVEILKDLDPRIRQIAILFNPETAALGGKYFLPSFKSAGEALGVEAIEAPVHNAAEIEQTIDALARKPNSGLVAMAEIFTVLNKASIIRLAANNHLPLMCPFRFFTDEGGLISYGIDLTDLFHRAASYVDRILKGAKPADLPVQAPTKFEMVINLKTAKALGIAVPANVLALADEAIE
jgi:putative tryptophan/tyrosine transport system substrate-binding protein